MENWEGRKVVDWMNEWGWRLGTPRGVATRRAMGEVGKKKVLDLGLWCGGLEVKSRVWDWIGGLDHRPIEMEVEVCGVEVERKEDISKKPFSPDVSSPRPDEASRLFASRPSGSPEAALPFISCVWCARTPHFPSKASDALLATPPPPSAFLLYPPTYLLVYRPPAYSYQLRASGSPPRSPLTSSDLDLSAPVR